MAGEVEKWGEGGERPWRGEAVKGVGRVDRKADLFADLN